MKLLFIALIAFAASVSSAPTEPPLTDDEAFEIINKIYNAVDKPQDPFQSTAINIFHTGAERKCILNQLKKYKVVERILRYSTYEGDEDQNKTFAIFFLHYFGVLCTENIDALLEYVFANVQTLNILYRGFINEPELKEYVEKVHCANAYAIEHNIFKSDEYPFVTQVESQEQCQQDQFMFRHISDGSFSQFISSVNLVTTNEECFKNLWAKTESVLLRAVLLIQFELNGEQYNREKKNFIIEIHNIAKGYAECSFASGNEI